MKFKFKIKVQSKVLLPHLGMKFRTSTGNIKFTLVEYYFDKGVDKWRRDCGEYGNGLNNDPNRIFSTELDISYSTQHILDKFMKKQWILLTEVNQILYDRWKKE